MGSNCQLQCTREISSSGVEINVGGSEIYFDGALPPYKRQTRLDRLLSYVSRLRAYKSRLDEVEKKTRGSSHLLGDTYNQAAAIKALPPPPFLVPAVLEVLLKSQHAQNTYVVPDEADGFCVAAVNLARESNCPDKFFVFTNDSDLILYEYQRTTTVVTIDEMRESEAGNSKVLSALVIPTTGSEDCVKTSLEDLRRLAFSLHKGDLVFYPTPTDGMAPSAEDFEFRRFVERYETPLQNAVLEVLHQNRGQRDDVPISDPRISEIIQQTANPSLRADASIMEVFCPMLWEDPSRASAWQYV